MAKFSTSFLAGLGAPNMTQSLFNLGSAIGSVPGQRASKQIRDANAAELSKYAQGSPEFFEELSRQAAEAGNMQRAEIMAQKAGEVRAKEREAGIQQSGRIARSKAMMGALQAELNNPNITPERRERALDLLRTAAQAGEGSIAIEDQVNQFLAPADPKAGLMVIGNRLFDANTRKEIPLGEAKVETLDLADLEKIATRESVINYLNSGETSAERDTSLLRAKAEEAEKGKSEGGKGSLASQIAQTDGVLATIDNALGLEDDYWAFTYDIGKFVPTSSARELETYVKTLEGNLAFDRLQKMRSESKTGGALGQVSNIELGLLKSTVAALDPAAPNFGKQLRTVRASYERFKRALLGKDPVDPRYQRASNGHLFYEDEAGEWVDLTKQAELEEGKE